MWDYRNLRIKGVCRMKDNPLSLSWSSSHLLVDQVLKAEQHPVVIFTMFCSLFQIAISFFEGINMHLKEHFLRTAKISFKFEWINWFLKHWSQCGRVSSAYPFAYNFLSLIHISPKWTWAENRQHLNDVFTVPWCLNLKENPPKYTCRRMPGSHSKIISYYYRRVWFDLIWFDFIQHIIKKYRYCTYKKYNCFKKSNY